MTVDQDATTTPMIEMLTHFEVERFLFEEAALLDAHRYPDWLELFAEDVNYFMPLRRTRTRREMAGEFTRPGEMAWFDDAKPVLAARVAKLATGTAWAEDPPSRTRHLITNVRVVEDSGSEIRVDSNFHVYRTRLKSEEQQWIGSRHDTLRRREDGGFLIARRTILLEQTLLLTANLSTFF